ncbi:serine--tRNA ligase [Nitratiruptor sp. YY09-18]|uniref:serine--tRNA ligase n=1 Tax=Nitratiruptor sp. YY09-18 TaxID=2724901 RepID=UPI001916C442|nr:serine--tRNA ligase [Nitratiruptor sp. YY09-18]BCD67640.1 seryl-tRNA synthetase [Nitratiruptor sp. YY09-18]
MIDLRALEKNFDVITKRLQTKGVDEKILEELRILFEEYKKHKRSLEDLQAKQNSLSKLFGEYKREGKDINELKSELEENKAKIAALQDIVRQIDEKLANLALQIPNPPDPDVPVGESEDDNVVIKTVLEPKEFDFEPKEHWELGEKLGWIDFERGVKLAKSRFSVLKNEAAKLERALINFMLDHNASYGFEEVCVPFMANSATLLGTGQLPKFEDDLFKICDEDLYMIPTAEVPLTNLYRDEIIKDLSKPIKLTAYTPCFRKEAGSGGRDVRGMIRQHQFDKVELVAITRPDQSDAMLEEMVACASELLTKLGLPHRHVMLCTGDLGFSAAKTIDLEVWLPGQGKYREISSISNTRDFQARRAKIRYKDGKKNQLVHTLNGSGLAVGRTLIAIMENYQTKDGNIEIPKALESYL